MLFGQMFLLEFTDSFEWVWMDKDFSKQMVWLQHVSAVLSYASQPNHNPLTRAGNVGGHMCVYSFKNQW